MYKLNISGEFIKWVKLFFRNVSAAVNLNGSPWDNFKIEKRIRQGCPIVPYFFSNCMRDTYTHDLERGSQRKTKRNYLAMREKK
jgi:hypothetical protein